MKTALQLAIPMLLLPFTLAAPAPCSAVDVFSGPKIVTARLANDQRTDLQVLEGQVKEMDFTVKEANAVIKAQQQEIEALKAAQIATQDSLDALLAKITVDDDEILLTAQTITLVADDVDVIASRTSFMGTLDCVTVEAVNVVSGWVECAAIVADAVIAKSYTPGAGNVW